MTSCCVQSVVQGSTDCKIRRGIDLGVSVLVGGNALGTTIESPRSTNSGTDTVSARRFHIDKQSIVGDDCLEKRLYHETKGYDKCSGRDQMSEICIRNTLRLSDEEELTVHACATKV
jgi:hypothetical protein